MKCKNLFIIGFVLAAFGATAQTVTDNRAWTKLTYRIEPAKGLDLKIALLKYLSAAETASRKRLFTRRRRIDIPR